MTVASTPLFVTAKITHENPDIDDVAAIFLFGQRNTEEFLNTTEAPIELITNRAFDGKTAAELEALGKVAFGVLGSWTDEHARDGQSKAAGDCCAVRVAKRMYLDKEPQYRRIIEYAQAQNNFAQGGEFDLGPLLKLAFRYCCHGTDEEKQRKIADVFYYANIFLTAVVCNETAYINKTPPTGTVPYSFDDIIVSWMLTHKERTYVPPQRGFIPSDPKMSRGMKVASKVLSPGEHPEMTRILDYGRLNQMANNSCTESKFDLATLVRLAFLHNVAGDPVDIIVGAHLFLTAMYEKEKRYQRDIRQVWNDERLTQHRLVQTFVTTPSGKQKLYEFLLTSSFSSLTEFQRFCRSKEGKNAAVIVQRQPSGNTQIFFDQKVGFDPAMVVDRLRYEERISQGLVDDVPREVLMSQGDSVPGAEMWYFDGHQILNGSLTAAKPPTKLPVEVINQIVYEAMLDQVDSIAKNLFQEEYDKLLTRQARLQQELRDLERKM